MCALSNVVYVYIVLINMYDLWLWQETVKFEQKITLLLLWY